MRSSMLIALLLLVAAADPFKEASLYLSGIEGLELYENEKGEILLKGEVQRQSDLKKIRVFTKDFPQIREAFSLAPEALLQIERLLTKRLKALEPQAKLHRRGQIFFLAGSFSDSTLASLRKIYAQVQGDQDGVGSLRAGDRSSIFLEIALVEVKRSALSRLGTRLESPVGLTSLVGRQSSISADPIRIFLDLALQKGEARIHAKQSIVSQNGRRGTFMAGGEFPIKVVSGLVAKVEFKRFGLILNVTPQLQGGKSVHLDIDSEISDVDMGSMVDGVPVLLKKEIRTQLSAKLDQMLAIAGIVENRQSQFVDRIPGLSSIPGLGRLFESEDFKRHQSEAYVFITPRLLTSPWLPSPEL